MLESITNAMTNVLEVATPQDANLDLQLKELKFQVLYRQFTDLTNKRILGNKTDKQLLTVMSGKSKILAVVNRFKA